MLKVLLVDDSYRAVEGLVRHIPWDETGCVCAGTAANGRDALELARKLLPNVVITDVRMPIMDGVELCSHLHEEFPGTALIVLSAYDDFEYAKQLIPLGVRNYFLKPMDDAKIRELAQMLSQISQTRRADARGVSNMLALSWEGKLSERLKAQDAEGLGQILEEIRDHQEHLSFQAAMDLSSRLIHFLYSFIHRLGLPDSVMQNTLDQSLYQLQTAVSRETAAAFVREEYLSFLTAMSAGNGNDYSRLAESLKAYIQKNYADPALSTGSLAKKFRISQSYLCHIFKESENSNINAYLTGVRIEKADELLRTDMSILEIATRVGYTDPHYFTKVYKKVKGISPSEMRRLHLHVD